MGYTGELELLAERLRTIGATGVSFDADGSIRTLSLGSPASVPRANSEPDTNDSVETPEEQEAKMARLLYAAT